MECYVKNCGNKSSEGKFVGRFCKPCYVQLKKIENLRGKMNCTEEGKEDLLSNFTQYIKEVESDLKQTTGEVVLCLVQGQGIMSHPRKEYLKRTSEGVYVTAEGTGFSEGWKIEEI